MSFSSFLQISVISKKTFFLCNIFQSSFQRSSCVFSMFWFATLLPIIIIISRRENLQDKWATELFSFFYFLAHVFYIWTRQERTLFLSFSCQVWGDETKWPNITSSITHLLTQPTRCLLFLNNSCSQQQVAKIGPIKVIASLHLEISFYVKYTMFLINSIFVAVYYRCKKHLNDNGVL